MENARKTQMFISDLIWHFTVCNLFFGAGGSCDDVVVQRCVGVGEEDEFCDLFFLKLF